MKILLNSDLGESFGIWNMGADEDIMKLIDMANIACGFHASDPLTMDKTVKFAKKNSVSIGAHPGYPDLVGFGRRSIKCSSKEIESFIIYQCGALEAICIANDVHVEYVKPHGALANDMMKSEPVFLAILRAVSSYNKKLKLMILSSNKNDYYEKLAKPFGVKLIYEVFADRAYTKDGFLVPRTQKGAVIHSAEVVMSRIKLLKTTGKLTTVDGNKIDMKADSICVHGDNKKALDLVKSLREFVDEV
ncbi:MAG: 5-oxoprolinase subunit PxpA [Sulfurospirillum sp.]|nr:5-oxoprolinase subunit PxpA [Sulfurospirillum sp.]